MADTANPPRAGLHNVGSYQASGHPFLTGSTVAAGTEVRVQFPLVTKAVEINSISGILRVHFNSTSSGNVISGNHYWILPNSGTFDNTVKCKEIYISSVAGATFQLFAELTGITGSDMYPLTGSGLTA